MNDENLKHIIEQEVSTTTSIPAGTASEWPQSDDGGQDQTEQLRTELQQSQERYRSFLQQSSEAIWRMELEEPVPIELSCEEQIDRFYQFGYLAECNDAMARMYGYEQADQILGAKLDDLLVRDDPANVEYLRALVHSDYRLNDAESHEVANDGTPRYFLNNLVGIIENGCVVRAWGTQRDITEQKHAQEALRRSEERFRLAVEAANMGPWEYDVQTGRVYWSTNLELIHGLVPGTFGGTFEDYQRDIHPDDLAELLASLQRTLETGNEHNLEYRIILPDGQLRWVMGKGQVIRDAQHRPTRMTGVCMDITERKSIERERESLLEAERTARLEAEKANRIKDEFLSTLSHELRTPLNAILGWTELIRTHSLSIEEVQKGLEIISRNTRMQAQIVDDLLDMGRIISGKIRLNIQRIELQHVISAAIDSIRPAAHAKKILIQSYSSSDHGIAMVVGDPNRLQQIIWNLLSNAIKFTPAGGEIKISVKRIDSKIELAINDTGEGINPEILSQIFERFRQADSSTTRRHGGLGLGLAIVKSLIEMHGGSVRAESAGVGMGSTFVVSIPIFSELHHRTIEQPHHPAAPSHTVTEDKTAPLDGVRAFVVDDDSDGRELVRRILEESGATVATATSAREALSVIGDMQPDVIICDIGMPDVDGYQFMRELRLQPPERGGGIPALALTAFARHEDRTQAIIAGYQMHVAKPAEPLELVAVVATLTGRVR